MVADKRSGVAHAIARGLVGAKAVLVLLAGASSLSCAQTAREVARAATPAAVEGAVKKADDPEMLASMSKILADARIRKASAQLAESVAAGAVDGLTRDEQTARLEEVGSRLVRQFTATITQTALNQIANEQFEQRLEAALRSATAGAMQGVGDAAREQGPEFLAFVGDAAREQGPEFLTFVGEVAREAGRNAAFGVDEAVRERQRDAEAGRTGDAGVLVGLGETAEATVGGIPRAVAVVFGVSIVALIALVWMLVRLQRRVQSLSQQLRAEGSRQAA